MKVEAKIVFYNFKRVQGWRWWAIRWLTCSTHTHAHLELGFSSPVALLVCDGKPMRVMHVALLEKLGTFSYKTFPLGCIDFTETDLQYVRNYPKPRGMVSLAYYIFGRWLGLRHPVGCVTFICDYLRLKGWNTPDLFTPHEQIGRAHV